MQDVTRPRRIAQVKFSDRAIRIAAPDSRETAEESRNQAALLSERIADEPAGPRPGGPDPPRVTYPNKLAAMIVPSMLKDFACSLISRLAHANSASTSIATVATSHRHYPSQPALRSPSMKAARWAGSA